MSKPFISFAVRGALFAGLGLALYFAVERWYPATAGAEPAIAFITPQRASIEDKTLAIGSIAPRAEIKIKSQVAGIVESLKVEPGKWVKRGDLIAELRPLTDAVDVNEAQSRLDRAALEEQRIRLEYERKRRLHERHLISNAEFQDDELSHHLSKEALAAAHRNLELKLKGVSARFSASSTRILATVDGMVLERPVAVGDFIIETNAFNEGSTIVTLADMHKLLFKGWVEEIDAARLSPGMSMTVSIGALPGRHFPATLESIAPKARIEQGRVRFAILAALDPGHTAEVRAGYSATAEIVFSRHAEVLAIPEAYLTFRGDEPRVKLLDAGGSLREQSVKTGLSDGILIEIVAGLHASDRLAPP
jgi:HlyD family secretion protein